MTPESKCDVPALLRAMLMISNINVAAVRKREPKILRSTVC
jgi:hypothetical protein